MLPGDPNLPPGCRESEIDGPEMRHCEQCGSEHNGKDSHDWECTCPQCELCEECHEQQRREEIQMNTKTFMDVAIPDWLGTPAPHFILTGDNESGELYVELAAMPRLNMSEPRLSLWKMIPADTFFAAITQLKAEYDVVQRSQL